MAHNKSLSLTKLEESILREYKRVSYGEETPHYDVQSIYYSDLPKQLPPFLNQKFKKSIILYNYSYFQMITFAVFQYLFSSESAQKKIILEKIKAKICKQEFMFGSNFIKGLLVKGLRSVIEKRDKESKPIAQILLKNQAMNAFSQFWKEIIEEQSNEECVKHSDIPENLAYRYLSNFLGINFQLYWKIDNNYNEEIIESKAKIADEFLTIIIFDKNLIESIINKVLEENEANEASERGYILLLTSEFAQKTTILPFSHEKINSVEIDELMGRVSAVTKKGNDLLNKFRHIYREMRQSLQ